MDRNWWSGSAGIGGRDGPESVVGIKRIQWSRWTGLRTLRFSQVKDFGGGVVRPSLIETDSPLYKGYKSAMIYAGIKQRVFPDEVFTLNFLPRVGTIRPE